MKKVKSFTLIEVMVASLIFLVVSSTAVSAFALIRKSNEKTDDIRMSDQCVRQAREVLSEVVRANQSQSRIAGIDSSDPNRFTITESEDQNTGYIGVAIFESETSVKAIYKISGIYYIGDYTLDTPTTIRRRANSSEIMSSDCLAFQNIPIGLVWSNDIAKPFKVYFEKHYPDYDANKIEDKIYKVFLEDLVYHASDDGFSIADEVSALGSNTMSKLFANLTSSARKLW